VPADASIFLNGVSPLPDEAYTIQYSDENSSVEAAFHSFPTIEDWQKLIEAFHDSLKNDYLHWRINTTRIDFLNSHDIGMIVGLNTSLIHRGGTFGLIVRDESKVAQILHATRIDEIVEVVHA
jgi:anti-anti-sigma regulatory factor